MARLNMLNIGSALAAFITVSLALPTVPVNSTQDLSAFTAQVAQPTNFGKDSDFSHLEKRKHKRLHINCCHICQPEHPVYSKLACTSVCAGDERDHRERLNKQEKAMFLQTYFPVEFDKFAWEHVGINSLEREIRSRMPGLLTEKGDEKDCWRYEYEQDLNEKHRHEKHRHGTDNDNEKRDWTTDSEDESDDEWSDEEWSDEEWSNDELSSEEAHFAKRYVHICVRCDAICAPGSSVFNAQACRSVCKHNEDDDSECLNSRQRNALWQAYPSLKSRIPPGVQWSEVKQIIEEEMPELLAD